MYVTNLEKTARTVPNMQGASGVTKQVPISKSDGAPNFSVRVFTIEPGGHTPFHNHPFEHLNYIIAGEGVLVGQEKETSIGKGDFALVLPGEQHQYKNTSKTQSLVLMCAVPKDYE
jgi:quercetin dioxygenase-like cupin family protein